MSALESRALELLDHGPQTARELASHLGIQHNSVWAVLKPLRLAGAIQIAYVKNRGRGAGPGRGVAIYERVLL